MSKALIFELQEAGIGCFNVSSLRLDDLKNIPRDILLLSFENSDATDKHIRAIPRLEKIRCIDLDSTQISDSSMEVISKFKTLEEVWIEDVRINDEGFKKLADLPNLKYVSFLDTEVSDDAFNYVIDRLPQLKYSG